MGKARLIKRCNESIYHNTHWPEKPFVKLRPAYSVKLVFSYVVNGIKIKIK